MALLAIVCGSHAVNAAELNVFGTSGIRSALSDIATEFQRVTGHKIVVTYARTGDLRKRFENGEYVDVLVLAKPAIDELAKQQKIVNDVTIARSAVAAALRKGAPKPDVSTTPALRETLLSATSIGYLDPARASLSGIHFQQVLDRLGLAEQLKQKIQLYSTAPVMTQAIAKGEAALGFFQISEILSAPEIEFAGRLPDELQSTTDLVFSAALNTRVKEPAIAKAFVEFLSSPSAAAILKAKGVESLSQQQR